MHRKREFTRAQHTPASAPDSPAAVMLPARLTPARGCPVSGSRGGCSTHPALSGPVPTPACLGMKGRGKDPREAAVPGHAGPRGEPGAGRAAESGGGSRAAGWGRSCLAGERGHDRPAESHRPEKVSASRSLFRASASPAGLTPRPVFEVLGQCLRPFLQKRASLSVQSSHPGSLQETRAAAGERVGSPLPANWCRMLRSKSGIVNTSPSPPYSAGAKQPSKNLRK